MTRTSPGVKVFENLDEKLDMVQVQLEAQLEAVEYGPSTDRMESN